jgi:transcriptional regulator of NAD metabolism
MKIRVKHGSTEVVVEDDGLRTDTNYGLIHFNQEYVIKLVEKIAENIIKINGGIK